MLFANSSPDWSQEPCYRLAWHPWSSLGHLGCSKLTCVCGVCVCVCVCVCGRVCYCMWQVLLGLLYSSTMSGKGKVKAADQTSGNFSLIPSPRPAFCHLQYGKVDLFRTASDGKLGGTWEWGYGSLPSTVHLAEQFPTMSAGRYLWQCSGSFPGRPWQYHQGWEEGGDQHYWQLQVRGSVQKWPPYRPAQGVWIMVGCQEKVGLVSYPAHSQVFDWWIRLQSIMFGWRQAHSTSLCCHEGAHGCSEVSYVREALWSNK